MSLKAELEVWAAALAAYDAEKFDESLDLFFGIADSSKIYTNIGLIYATLGDHETAVEQFFAATQLDKYLAIAYFQSGVSNFLLARYERSLKDFDEALMHLRGNQDINYEQLGLKFKLYAAEVLFNRGLSLVYQGRMNEGLASMEGARKEKKIEEHSVIDEAIRDGGDGYTVFSIPVGILYRPSENKLKNAKQKDYLGKAKLVAAEDAAEAYTAFTGVTRLKQGITPQGSFVDDVASSSDLDGSVTVPRPRTTIDSIPPATRQRSKTILNPPEFLSRGSDTIDPLPPVTRQRSESILAPESLSTAIDPILPTTRQRSRTTPEVRARGSDMPRKLTIRRQGSSPDIQRSNTLARPAAKSDIQRSNTLARPAVKSDIQRSNTTLARPAVKSDIQRSNTLARPAVKSERGDDDGGYYDDYIDSYRDSRPPVSAERGTNVNRARINADPNDFPPSKALSRVNTYSPGSGVRRRPTRRNTVQPRSRMVTTYDEEEGYVSGEYDDNASNYELMRIRVKVHYQEEVRGMAVSIDVTFEEFMDKLAAKFGLVPDRLDVKFKDEDGARVSLKDESDYEMALETVKEMSQGKAEGRLEVWCTDS